jgi:PPM family protein phosphatase
MPWFFRLSESGEDDLAAELKSCLEACQNRVEAAAEVRQEDRKMGATLTMAYLYWPRLFVVHAGDSRCYILRGSRLHQVTKDHTVAQQLMDKGVLSADEAEDSRWSHALWNCIGGGSHDLNPDAYKATLKIGDTLVLCTDGLTKAVEELQIAQVLCSRGSAEECCTKLVALANAGGGPDNITAVVARFLDTKQAESAANAASEAAPTSEPEAAESALAPAWRLADEI